VQDFLRERFGRWGTGCYNFVIANRLVSEVFANVLVIGILFGVAGSTVYTWTILVFSAISLFYSMLGGLRASLRTDVFQMVIFLVTLLLIALVVFNQNLSLGDLAFKPFVFDQSGPVLIFGEPYSNLAATQAMRRRAEELDIPPARVICNGDLIATCAEPQETLQLVRDWGIKVVQKNCE
jgi:hypothetical protein